MGRLPELFFINDRPGMVLRPGKKLYRSCKICRMRTHEMKMCPQFSEWQLWKEMKVRRIEDGQKECQGDLESIEEFVGIQENTDETTKEKSLFSPAGKRDEAVSNVRKRLNTSHEGADNREKQLKAGELRGRIE